MPWGDTAVNNVFRGFETGLRKSVSALCKLLLVTAAINVFIIAGADAVKGVAEATEPNAEELMPRFDIEINNTATGDDDYFCWSPTPARIRMIGGTEPVKVVVDSRNGGTGGEVVFQEHRGARPTASNFSPAASIELEVAANGNGTPFWVAGKKASTNRKDVEIFVARADDDRVVATRPVMVRVRKDATRLNPGEIGRLLEALRDHHRLENATLGSKYIKYVDAHDRGGPLNIHGARRFPLFLAWHRAFLLSFERELQILDPSVTIPYWRFDRHDPSPDDATRIAIFTPEFMGTVLGQPSAPGGYVVNFSDQNPLTGWRTAANRLVRTSDGTPAPIPAQRLDGLSGTNTYHGFNGINFWIERGYHNRAHRMVGGRLGSIATAVEDPLFFLLHANVDRAWALWQELVPAVRFDQDNLDAYYPQGTHPGPEGSESANAFSRGSYKDDPMWPWGGAPDDQQDSDASDDWPELRINMPPRLGETGAVHPPTPGSMIDYLDKLGTGGGIGVCYDRIRF